MNENGKVIFGLLAGAAIGAALGVLFAPHKGRVTRKKISNKANEYAGDIEDQFSEFMDTVKHKFEEMKEKANETIDKVEAKAEHVKEKASAVTNNS